MMTAPRPRVLLVDDNAAQLDNLSEILAGAGYGVAGAAREDAGNFFFRSAV